MKLLQQVDQTLRALQVYMQQNHSHKLLAARNIYKPCKPLTCRHAEQFHFQEVTILQMRKKVNPAK